MSSHNVTITNCNLINGMTDGICLFRSESSENNKSNKNALLNKLIPTLVEVRKARRNEIEYVLKEEYQREDTENIYNAVNTVIDKVYFNDAELNILDEYIWIRPSKETMAIYDEIETSEIHIILSTLQHQTG